MSTVTIPSVRYAVLGPLSVCRAGQEIDLGWGKQQAVLAALLFEMNRAVPVDRIVAAVWGGQRLPRDARNAVQTYVSRLRRSLEPGVLVSSEAGYLICGDPALLDLNVFEQRLCRAREHHERADLDSATAELDVALGLWRGEPFGGLVGSGVEAERRRLLDLRLTGFELRAQILLDRGHCAEVITELTGIVAEYPTREHLWALLMLALYRASRQTEALAAFQDVRRRLADELGLDPGQELRELHERILRGDPGLTGVPAAKTSGRNDLPADVADFTGRDEQARHLLGATETVQVIDGMAGVGKTALAVHVAHRLAHRFPDGRLFLDLHGHSPDRQPTDSLTALELLLRAMGVPSGSLPATVDERAALWRAELAGRRVLVVLDNAASAAQVRPLLPGSSHCRTLITSRRRLVDLESAYPLSLEVLPPDDAVALFCRVLGQQRAAGAPDAVADVVRLCAQLPLAVRDAAARLRTRPAWSVEYLADRLRERGRLAELSAGDRFTASYRRLSPRHQRLYRLLGLHPGRDFDAGAAASLVDADPDNTARLLEDLVDAHLLRQVVPDRYHFHDLVREHAEQVAEQVEPEDDRTAATTRLVHYYLHRAVAAKSLVDPHLPVVQIGEPIRPFAKTAAALTWLAVERHNLMAVRSMAIRLDSDFPVWRWDRLVNPFHWCTDCHQDTLAS